MNMCMDVYVYGCLCVWMCIYMDVYVYGCVCTWMCMCMDVYVYGCVYEMADGRAANDCSLMTVP